MKVLFLNLTVLDMRLNFNQRLIRVLKFLSVLTFVPVDVLHVLTQLTATFPYAESYNEILTYFFSNYIEGAAGRDPQLLIVLEITMMQLFKIALKQLL